MEEVQNIPELRFSEYNDEWSEVLIEDYFEFKNGLNKEKEYFGSGTPIINFMDVYKLNLISKGNIHGLVTLSENEINRYSVIKGDVFFTRTSETIDDIGMSATLIEDIANCVFSGFVLRARPIKNIFHPTFTSYLFNTQYIRKEIVTKSSMTTRALTSGTLLYKVKFNFPKEILEQQKIATFLTAVDDKIQQLTKKKELLEQYKKAVMQKIFSQEIRFKFADGKEFPEWEEKKLGDIFSRVTYKNNENNNNVLTISAQQGLINQKEFFNKSVSAKDVTGYYLLKEGDFAYNKSYSKGYPMGAIKRLNRYKKGVVSTLYICFRIKQNNSPKFYEQYFDSGFMNKELHKIAQEGARNHGLLNMSVVEFFESIKIPSPYLLEQETIANFLTSIDKKIESVNTQLERSKAFKKGLLQKMFV